MAPFMDLPDLAARFSECRLAKDEWTHAAHLAVGAWHVAAHGADDALAMLRTGIRRLNDSHGTPNTPTRGYHETITRAYVVLVGQFLAACAPEQALADRVDALLASPLGDRDVLLRCYSRERLMSVEARAAWLEPDLMPLQVSQLGAAP